MTGTIIGIAATVVLAILAGFAFYIAHGEKQARRKAESENREIREHEARMSESITKTNAKKESLQSGDSRADFSAGIDVLHEFAKKKRR